MRAYRRPLGPLPFVFGALFSFMLAGTVGCDDLFGPRFPSVPPLPTDSQTPTVVDIVPGVVQASPLHHFLLEAIPRTSDGTPVAGLPTSWAWDPSGPITLTPDPDGGPFARVVVNGTVQVGETETVTATVTLASETVVTSQPATIHFSGPPTAFGPTAHDDRLEVGNHFSLFSGDPFPPADVLILDTQVEIGPSSTDCWWDSVVAFAGVVDFAENLIPGCERSDAPSPQPSKGGPEIVVFSGRGEPIFEDSTMLLPPPPASPRVTSSRSDVLTWSQPDDPQSIRLHLWEGVDGDLSPLILDHVKYAAEALRLSRMGVVLEYGPVRELKPLPGETEVQFDVEQWHCNTYVDQFLYPDFVVEGEKVVHVLYVEEIINPYLDVLGETRWNTGSNDTGYGLILVEEGAPWSTFLHELGHLLGHNYSNYVPEDGHTNDMEGFDCSNAMWVGQTLTCPGIRNRFTLGQVFRSWTDPGMNWIQHLGSLATTRNCPPEEMGSIGRCPALSLDVPGTGGGT